MMASLRKTSERNKGFTLIEAAIAMILIGLISVPMIMLYNVEREVADALLAINHYRFIDKEDVRNKCSRATAFKEYGAANCVEVMSRANYADVYDNITVRKAAMDRGGGR